MVYGAVSLVKVSPGPGRTTVALGLRGGLGACLQQVLLVDPFAHGHPVLKLPIQADGNIGLAQHQPTGLASCRIANRIGSPDAGAIQYGGSMTSRTQVVEWAREQADALQSDMKFAASDGLYGGFWTVTDRSKTGVLMARAAAGLEFLRQHAGGDSEWLRRATIAYESDGNRSSMESGVHAIGEILRLWAAQVAIGATRLPAEFGESIRAVASTDVMEQVRRLIVDHDVHAAAPIVLAGAALETALRGAVAQLDLPVAGRPSISAYSGALRARDVITKQDAKDLEQMAGLRNAAAHGQFDQLSIERAGLMEQQVNLFLGRLRDVLEARSDEGRDQ